MAIHVRGDVAIIQTGDTVMLLISGDEAMARSYRSELATLLGRGPAGIRDEDWQRLEDLHAALNLAFGEASRPKVRRARFPKVCEIPDCGCSGNAHP